MNTATKVKVRQLTYLGVPVLHKEISLPHGAREVRIHWLAKAVGQDTEWEAGTIVSGTYRGDACKGTLETLVDRHIVTEF